MKARVLVVDDDAGMRDLLESALSKAGQHVTKTGTMDEALVVLAGEEIDVVVTDLRLDGESGLSLCRRATELRPDVPVILLTAFGSMDSAVAAIRAGAYDFITKPVDLQPLSLTIRRAVEHRRLRSEVRQLREARAGHDHVGALLGQSTAMGRVYDLIARVSDSEASILITGESGTGKELVARALHERSPRRGGPFVAVNCAAISAQLLESELFGHVKGAFTDAKSDRAGLFIESNGCGKTPHLPRRASGVVCGAQGLQAHLACADSAHTSPAHTVATHQRVRSRSRWSRSRRCCS